MKKSIKIVATKEIDNGILDLSKGYNIDLVIKPVIRTAFLDNGEELANAIEKLDYDAIVFTSKNAVKAFSEIQLRHRIKVPQKLVYAVGHETTKFLKMLGFKAIFPPRQNARALARMISQNPKVKSVLFICGRKRRKELPEILAKHKVKVKSIAVYDTLNLDKKIDLRGVKGVLFFSPSAVKSYFFTNGERPGIVYFSIGPTTTETLERFTENKILTASQPNKAVLIKQVHKYFLTNPETELI